MLLQGSWWKRSMAEPQHQLSESHFPTSLSPTWLSMFTGTVSHVLSHLGSIPSADSIFIFISRQLCGKCPVMDSCSTTGHKLHVMRWYLTGMLPSRCTQHSFLFLSLASSPLRALQGEAAHQELPSCLAPEVSYTLQFLFWFLLLSSVHWTRGSVWGTSNLFSLWYTSLFGRDRQW